VPGSAGGRAVGPFPGDRRAAGRVLCQVLVFRLSCPTVLARAQPVTRRIGGPEDSGYGSELVAAWWLKSLGTIHQAYRYGMVLNAIVLWTTQYIDAAVAEFKAEGHEIRDEDTARLSPLEHKNLNLLGRHSFTASNPATGALRPLRDPDAPELDEDDTGAVQE